MVLHYPDDLLLQDRPDGRRARQLGRASGDKISCKAQRHGSLRRTLSRGHTRISIKKSMSGLNVAKNSRKLRVAHILASSHKVLVRSLK